MIDAVLSLHTNPYVCGVAKFNQRLARELGVHFREWRQRDGLTHPLYSLKFSEMPGQTCPALPQPYDLFLHDSPTAGESGVVKYAARAYAANPVIARAMRQYRPDVTELWCPSLLEPPKLRGAITVLTFGMLYKWVDKGGTSVADMVSGRFVPLLEGHYRKLKALLDATGETYTILLSMGVHEGQQWDRAIEESYVTFCEIFGAEHVELLGFLSDAALWREMQAATACAMFYSPALRANNTTFWAALDAGCPTITNLDEQSPVVARTYAHDVTTLAAFPLGPRPCGRDPHQGWEALLRRVREVEVSCVNSF